MMPATAAAALDIPHYVLDFESRFKDAVIEEFADAYVRGETPIPCVTCNQTVKFADLLTRAQALGAACLATGHYIRSDARGDATGSRDLRTPEDMGRDQSYFLFQTTQAQADYLRFPLGSFTKQETREMARAMGLSIADKPDSQDICFVPDGNYVSVIERLRPEAAEPGDIVHEDGRVLGRHHGIIHFTIGQRRGIGIAASEPLYVTGLEPAAARVIVGPKDALARRVIRLRDVNWLGSAGCGSFAPAGNRVRQDTLDQAGGCRPVCSGDGDEVRVQLDEPDFGISPGQACVFYEAGGRGHACWAAAILQAHSNSRPGWFPGAAAETHQPDRFRVPGQLNGFNCSRVALKSPPRRPGECQSLRAGAGGACAIVTFA